MILFIVGVLCCLKLFGPKTSGNIVLLIGLTLIEYCLIILGAVLFPAFVFCLFFKTR